MVVIVGGQMREGGITDSVELYDVASNELSQGERKMEFAKYQDLDPGAIDKLVVMKSHSNLTLNFIVWKVRHFADINNFA